MRRAEERREERRGEKREGKHMERMLGWVSVM
jgi:hypothetical protein